MMARPRHGFTLIEMLTAAAALVIVLGLMLSLARYVRGREAEALTQQVLLALDDLLQADPALRQRLDDVPPLLADEQEPEEQALRAAATRNSRALARILRAETDGTIFRRLPAGLYDDSAVRDAWGTPVVYMKPLARNVGIAPLSRWFVLSAGPDRQFTTLLDNLYSYERGLQPPAGHRE